MKIVLPSEFLFCIFSARMLNSSQLVFIYENMIFWSESVLLLRWISELKWTYTDFPSDIHLICAYCWSAGRRFLFAAAAQNHSRFQTSSFSDWMRLTRRPWVQKCLWSKNEWIELRLLLDVCAAHSHSKMAQQDGRVLRFTSSAVSRASILFF